MRISAVEVENLRGYEYTRLPLIPFTILVGENNEGKSSILKMLEQFLRIPASTWNGPRMLSEQEFDFWYPANNARHKARRLTLVVEFRDGRTARKFGTSRGGHLPLRFAITSTGATRLNVGPPRKNEVHDPKAEELFIRLQKAVELVVIPPVRDSRTLAFADKVTHQVKKRISEKIGHNRQAGAPKEYRLALESIEKIKKIVSLQSGELSKSVDSPLRSMLRASEVRVELFPKDIEALISQSMFLYLSTGEHDDLKVRPGEVGNGLQSLIDIGMTLEGLIADKSSKQRLLIVEEPEAFLHPSAQRQFMQYLRRALTPRLQAVLTTHSPIIVDESRYDEIVLVRNHRHFPPSLEANDRASIHTSLMTTASAEIFFARTIVFVEGEGDRAFLNTLLRRIRKVSAVRAELTGLVIQETGGCTFYAPWLKLVRSYKTDGIDPFNCLWIMDGDAASGNGGTRPVLRAAADCGFNLAPGETGTIVQFGDLSWDAVKRGSASVNQANAVLLPHGGHLFACDLEWALFNETSGAGVNSVKSAMKAAGISVEGDHIALARKLGSKISLGKASDGAKKQAFIRTLIAERLNLKELPPEIFRVLEHMFTLCFKSKQRASEYLAECNVAMSCDLLN